MATLTNIIKTIFTTEGAEGSANSVNNLTKAYTRLGAETSNSTRRFSAWAQASGGISATYAMAAAQVYALTSAYQALSSAANVMQLVEATKSYAAAVGTTGSQVINTLKQITDNQITMAQAAESANLALAAGFNVKQIEELVGGASRAARALGRDMTDSINRVIRGTIKLEPELLDELGVFIKLDDAVERYSQSVNKSASSLTNYEKRLAVLNEVTRQLKQNFDLITVSNNTSAAAFQKFSAAFQDTLTKVGGVLAEAIAPILTFLSKDIGTVLTTLGAVGLLVFSKLTSQLKDLGGSVASWGETTSRRLVALKADSTAIDAAIGKMQQSSDNFTGRLATGSRLANENIKELRTSLESGNMTLERARKAREDLNKAESAITAKKAPLTENEQKTLALIKNLRSGLDDYDKATAGANSRWITGLEKVTNGFNTVLGVVGRIGNALGYIGIAVAAIQLAGAIFDKDFLGAISAWWGKLYENSRNLKLGFDGIAASAINASKAMFENMKPEKIEQIAKASSELLESASKAAAITSRRQVISQARIGSSLESTQELRRNLEVPETFITTTIELNTEEAKTEVLKLQNTIKGLDITTTGTSVIIKKAFSESTPFISYQIAITKKLTEAYEKAATIAAKDPTAENIRKRTEALISLRSASVASLAAIGGALSSELEIPANRVIEALKPLQNKKGNIIIGDQEVGKFNALTGQVALTNAEVAKLAVSAIDLTNTLDKLFESGAGAEKLLPTLKALEDKLNELKKRNIIDVKLNVQYAEVKAAIDSISQSEERINTIRKQYSKEIEIAQNARAQGYIDANGKIAQSDAEIQANRIAYLNETMKKSLNISTETAAMAKAKKGDLFPVFDAIGGATNIEATAASIDDAKKQVEAAKVAAQALLGTFLNMGSALTILNKELDLKITKLEDELNILRMQNDLAEQRLQIQLAQTQQEGRIQNLQQGVKVQEAELQRLQANINLRKAQIAAAKELNSAQQNLLSSQKQLLQSQYDLAQAQTEAKYIAPQAVVQSKLAEAQAFSNLSTEKEIADLRMLAATLEYQKQLELLDLKQKQLDDQYRKDLEMNDLKMQAVKLDAAAKAAESQGQIQILQKQDEIRKANEQLEKEKIANQITNLANQKQILQQENNIAITKAEADKKAREAELLILQTKKDLQFNELKLMQEDAKFKTEYLNKLAEANKIEGFTPLKITNLTDEITKILNSYTEVNKKFETIGNLNTQIASSTENSLKRQLTLQNENINAQQNNLENQLNGIAQISALQDEATKKQIEAARMSGAGAAEAIRAVEIDRQAIITKYKTENQNILNTRQQQDLKYKEEIASILRTQDEMKKLFNGIAGVINNALNKGVDDLFEAMKNGTLTMQSFKQGVKDMFRNLAFDIQKEIFKQMTLKPITDWVSKQMSNLANMATEMITGVNPQSEAFTAFANNINKSLSGTGVQTVEVKGLQENIAAQTQLYQAVTGQGKPNLVTIAGQLAPVQIITAPGAAPLGGVTPPPGSENLPIPPIPPDQLPTAGADALDSSAEKAATSTGLLSGAFGSLGQGVTGLLGQLGPFGAIIGIVGKGLLSLLSFFGQALSSVISSIAGASAGGGGGLFGAIGNLFGGIFGGGSTPGGNIGGVLDGASLASIGNTPGMLVASGGPIRKMAAGGGVSLRDRVPTLLEPGEFVVRKPAVDNAGLPAMQRLNATGSTAPPPVKIDIQNQGTQKDAEQQGTPMFDGEAWVVKLILKDLRSNGPIRRGMRAGLG